MTLKVDQLVELKDQYSNVYPLSPTGARGWVRGRREPDKSDPEVLIEWDKSHWRFHGEKDGWTFEHHFQPVTDVTEALDASSMTEMPLPGDLMDRLVSEAQRRVEGERCQACGQPHDAQDEFLRTLQEAQEAALGSDGYFIVTVKPQNVDGYTIYEPQIFTNTLTDIAQRMIETQLIHVASQLYEQRILNDIANQDGR